MLPAFRYSDVPVVPNQLGGLENPHTRITNASPTRSIEPGRTEHIQRLLETTALGRLKADLIAGGRAEERRYKAALARALVKFIG